MANNGHVKKKRENARKREMEGKERKGKEKISHLTIQNMERISHLTIQKIYDDENLCHKRK